MILLRNKFTPYITIDWETFKVINYLMNRKYSKEFTVLTHCKRVEDEEYLEYNLYDSFIPEQNNNGVHTEYEPEAIFDLLDEGAKYNELRGHMHSHVNMGVTPSDVDVSEIKERVEAGGFSASIIMNKKGKIRGHVADYDYNFYANEVEVYIETPIAEEQFENIKLNLIKSAKSIEEVEDILDASLVEYCLDIDGGVDEEYLEFLCEQRFLKTAYAVHKPVSNEYDQLDFEKEDKWGLTAQDYIEYGWETSYFDKRNK